MNITEHAYNDGQRRMIATHTSQNARRRAGGFPVPETGPPTLARASTPSTVILDAPPGKVQMQPSPWQRNEAIRKRREAEDARLRAVHYTRKVDSKGRTVAHTAADYSAEQLRQAAVALGAPR
jgi:hypothetical protein